MPLFKQRGEACDRFLPKYWSIRDSIHNRQLSVSG
jgi:hypothetical protein